MDFKMFFPYKKCSKYKCDLSYHMNRNPKRIIHFMTACFVVTIILTTSPLTRRGILSPEAI